jgi:predicted  nucleic acid-binding Zn-ribbon protein
MRRILKLAVISFIVLNVTGCDAEIVDNIISTQILGSADDGDSENPRDDYRGPADLDAEDRLTKASSVQPKFNEVAGSAEAEPRDPAANTVVGDEAVAKSFNKVVSELRVRKNGNYTFNIDLDVNNVQLRHDGTVTIQVAAAVLNSQGVSVPNGGITNITFEFKRNAAGATDVIIAGDTANPDSTQANGDYNKTLSGPSGGINLQPGIYRLEFDLRITARAPVQIGNDGQRHRASVESAKATISLR